MRFLILITFVLSCAYANAQQAYLAGNNSLKDYKSYSPVTLNASYPVSDFKGDMFKADAPGQRMVRVGKTLVIAGGVLIVGGIILMSTADEIYYTTTTSPYGTEEEGDPKGALGLVMTIGGVGMIIPGAIVWSKGAKKYNAYKSTEKSLSLGVNKNGAGLRYRF